MSSFGLAETLKRLKNDGSLSKPTSSPIEQYPDLSQHATVSSRSISMNKPGAAFQDLAVEIITMITRFVIFMDGIVNVVPGWRPPALADVNKLLRELTWDNLFSVNPHLKIRLDYRRRYGFFEMFHPSAGQQMARFLTKVTVAFPYPIDGPDWKKDSVVRDVMQWPEFLQQRSALVHLVPLVQFRRLPEIAVDDAGMLDALVWPLREHLRRSLTSNGNPGGAINIPRHVRLALDSTGPYYGPLRHIAVGEHDRVLREGIARRLEAEAREREAKLAAEMAAPISARQAKRLRKLRKVYN